MSKKRRRVSKFRRRVFKMVSVGVVDDAINRMYDIISISALVINLAATIMNTFDTLRSSIGFVLDEVEGVTVAFFAVDYVLRLYTANCLYPDKGEIQSIIKYIFSFAGVIDLLSFAPYYMPVFFPAGAAVFRMFRVARILRLFRINAYYDSLNVITEVLQRKKQQLLSSVFLILVLMLASSLCMYSIENKAQPEVFTNAFSGIWWAASTLLTVGYGDIYPVTAFGKTIGIFIAFLGVGMVAIPTGIISAGFVEQYSRLSKIGGESESDMHFIKLRITSRDDWNNKTIAELSLPRNMIVAVVFRKKETLIPRGDLIIKAGDIIVLGASSLKHDKPIYLKEIVVRKSSKWNGAQIQELDISRQTFIVMIKRRGRTIIPNGDLTLCDGDRVILYSKVSTLILQDETEDEADL